MEFKGSFVVTGSHSSKDKKKKKHLTGIIAGSYKACCNFCLKCFIEQVNHLTVLIKGIVSLTFGEICLFAFLPAVSFDSLLLNSFFFFLSLSRPLEDWGATDLPAQGGGMMSGGGSSLNGILETEKVKRERFVNTVTIHRLDYKAAYMEAFGRGRTLTQAQTVENPL